MTKFHTDKLVTKLRLNNPHYAIELFTVSFNGFFYKIFILRSIQFLYYFSVLVFFHFFCIL